MPPVLVMCDMLDDHCYKAFIAKFAAKGFSLGCYFFLLVCVCVCVPACLLLALSSHCCWHCLGPGMPAHMLCMDWLGLG